MMRHDYSYLLWMVLFLSLMDSFSSLNNREMLQNYTKINEKSTTTWESTTSEAASDSSTLIRFIKDHLLILAGIGSGALICVILTCIICCWCHKRKRANRKPRRDKYDTIEMKPIPKKDFKKQRKNNSCSYMKLAYEYILSLGWNENLFDHAHDDCFCKKCCSTDEPDVISAANGKYVIPRGWVRVGLHVDTAFQSQHDIWNRWIVTFHGTTKAAAHSIVCNRQFCLPGDKLLDGSILGIREGHIPDKRHIYTSPTIAYSSLGVYCPEYEFDSQRNNRSYKVKIVLQCRQKPGSFTVQGETVGAKSLRLCPFVPNDRVEYYTEIRASIVAYGLLLHFEEVNDGNDF